MVGGGLKSKPHYAGKSYRECVRMSRATMSALKRKCAEGGFFWPAINLRAQGVQDLVAERTTDGRRATGDHDVVEKLSMMALAGELVACSSAGGSAALRGASKLCACCKEGGNSHAKHCVLCDTRKVKSPSSDADKEARDALLALQRDAPIPVWGCVPYGLMH